MHLHNWMKNIGDDVSLKDINIPGTHDSSTKYCQFSLFASCQKKSIAEQLSMGVRAFDIRVDGMTLVHSFCKCKESSFGKKLTLDKVIGDMFSFLTENPTETIVMLFKMDKGEDSGKCFSMLYENFIVNNPEKWYLENEIPTLGEVRGKIVLVRRTDADYEKSGLDFTMMPDHGGMKETSSSSFSPNGTDTVTVQDRYSLLRKKKWKQSVKPLLEKSKEHKNNLILNYFSTAGIPVIPRFNSKHINRKFLSYSMKNKNHYGILMFDFIDEKIAEKVIKTN
ncbi:MAG: phosphatidylinositol-specific phospholipase C domain-containing protein [Clostridia bacterium]|nr:phosphatidylinositol-specific phospholipase C domain-containing protein [Clostridia bacterium]